MIYSIWAITRGGVVLWNHELHHANGNPVSALVKNVLLLEKGGISSYTTNDNEYCLQWIVENKLKLYFVIITPKQHPVPYSITLLEQTQKRFISKFLKDTKSVDPWADYSEFTGTFEKLLKDQLDQARPANNRPAKFTPKPKTETPKSESETTLEPETPKENTQVAQPAKPRGIPQKKPGPFRGKGATRSTKKKSTQKEEKPRTKRKRKWGVEDDDDDYQPTSEDPEPTSSEQKPSADVPIRKIDLSNEPDSDSEDEEEEQESKKGFFSRYLPSLTGKTLSRDDLKPIIEQFQSHLNSKNVASSISESLCESVIHSLEGSHISTFASAKNLVKDALTASVTRILTPKRQIDILREIDQANQAGKPYSIVFVGVNGVGKSTSLAKVCSWLLQNKKSVLIAACDTFRSGAVEQLKVHADRLNVPVFEQGYASDPSNVAKYAIKKATQDKTNVCMIDTAGRMQDNEPLMTALSNLVHANNPNLVLFVGEALVGNDGVHQLQTFNDSLKRLSQASNHAVRKKDSVIDGIVLTKFDTIDDKVGAAVSMVYSTGIPIMFVGIGQHYHDIKTLNVDTIVRSLMR